MKKFFSKEYWQKFSKKFCKLSTKIYEFFLKKLLIQLKKNYSKNIVFSGGCALNSSANKFITDKSEKFEKSFY